MGRTGHGHVGHLGILPDMVPIQDTVVFPYGFTLSQVTGGTETRYEIEREVIKSQNQRINILIVGHHR